MSDQEWARAFVGCQIKGTGIRFGETVDVLVKKLAQVRQEAAGDLRSSALCGGDLRSSLEVGARHRVPEQIGGIGRRA